MDKTLADYIKRTQDLLKKEKDPDSENQYPVFPEDDETDSKKIPYGNH